MYIEFFLLWTDQCTQMATSRLKIIVYYCGPHIVLFGVNFGVFVCDFEDNNIMVINFVGSDKDIYHS